MTVQPDLTITSPNPGGGSTTASHNKTTNESPSPSRIAFGSCNNQDRENRLWSVIESRDPTAFIFGGDAIYADVHNSMFTERFPSMPWWRQTTKTKPRVECATPDRVRKLYRHQRQVPAYARLVDQKNVTVFGTIDDHDFGCDNADQTFEHKYETTNAFVEFIGEPNHSPMARRAAAGKGVYGVKLFDFGREEGDRVVPESEACIDPDYLSSSSMVSGCVQSYSDRSVAVFVLDVRTNKDPWRTGMDAYTTDHDGDFLGEEQWVWFETAISKSNAAVNVIVNGLQVHSQILPNPNIAESWGAFPSSQRRLYNAVLSPNVQAPFLISGDVHMTQLHRKDCRPERTSSSIDDTIGRPLMELTTSGMTHSWGRVSTPLLTQNGGEVQDNHVSQIIDQVKSYVASITMHTLHQLLPWRSLVKSLDHEDDNSNNNGNNRIETTTTTTAGMNGGLEGAKTGLQYSLERNFGELEFDWDDRTVTIRSIGEDFPNAPPLLAARVSFDQLSGKESMVDGRHFSTTTTENPSFSTIVSSSASASSSSSSSSPSQQNDNNDFDWICVDYRGHVSTVEQTVGYTMCIIALLSIFVVVPVIVPFCIVNRITRKIDVVDSGRRSPSSNSSITVTSSSLASSTSSSTSTPSPPLDIDSSVVSNSSRNISSSSSSSILDEYIPSMSSSVVSTDDDDDDER